jgi:hypothetical protein
MTDLPLNRAGALIVILLLHSSFYAAHSQDLKQQNEIFWHTDNSHGITWDITNEKRLPHDDNMEMSGSLVSGIISYKVDQTKQVHITRDVIFPQLRKYTKSNESCIGLTCVLNTMMTYYR